MGLGWRRELAAQLLTAPQAVGFVEVIAESCLQPGPQRREVEGLAEIWPVLPHGIQLSLGSADGIDEQHARRLGKLARALRAPLFSEHVAFTRGRGRDIGHLTQLPMNRTAVRVVARNLAKARRFLPDIPFLLENPAWTLRWAEDEMDEGSFFHEIVQATGCRLLLDIANLYANAINSGQDPRVLLRSYPLSHVAMVHIAGGAWREGFYVDTHCHATPGPVFELLDDLVRLRGPLPVVLERDGRYPPFAQLAAELAQARSILDGHATLAADANGLSLAPTPRAQHALARTAAAEAADTRMQRTALSEQQARLATLLTTCPQPCTHATSGHATHRTTNAEPDRTGWDDQALAHSRSVLLHKRVDEAIGLLWRSRNASQSQQIDLYALALERLANQPAARSLPTVVDALHVARAAQKHRGLASAALLDQLSLQARCVEHSEGASLRFLPYVARMQRTDGRRTWVWKPPGRRSRIHVYTHTPQTPSTGGHTRSS